MPTLRWRCRGDAGGLREATTYAGERNAVAMMDFINARAGIVPPRSVARVAGSGGSRLENWASMTGGDGRMPVRTLRASSFDSTVSSAHHDVLVAFCVPWSERCDDYAGEYARVALAFEEDAEVVVAVVDLERDPDLGKRMEISSYPTVRLFPRGSAGTDTTLEPFTGQRVPLRDAGSVRLIELLGEIRGEQGWRTADGRLGVQVGRVAALDTIAARFPALAEGDVVEAERIAASLKGLEHDHADLCVRALLPAGARPGR